MNAYRVIDSDDSDAPTRWAGSMSGARDVLRQTEAIFRARILVQLVRVRTDKAALIALLDQGAPAWQPLRTWRGTRRGGLREIDLD